MAFSQDFRNPSPPIEDPKDEDIRLFDELISAPEDSDQVLDAAADGALPDPPSDSEQPVHKVNDWYKLFDDEEAFREHMKSTGYSSRQTLNLSVRRTETTRQPNGAFIHRPVLSAETVNPQGSTTPEQRLALITQQMEKEITTCLSKLKKCGDDAQARKDVLLELKEKYDLRFAIDTAYQDYKVRQIEERAQKLRAEVTERKNSQNEWASAMVTLAKMRVMGIDIPNSVSPNVSRYSLNSTRQPISDLTVGRQIPPLQMIPPSPNQFPNPNQLQLPNPNQLQLPSRNQFQRPQPARQLQKSLVETLEGLESNRASSPRLPSGVEESFDRE